MVDNWIGCEEHSEEDNEVAYRRIAPALKAKRSSRNVDARYRRGTAIYNGAHRRRDKRNYL